MNKSIYTFIVFLLIIILIPLAILLGPHKLRHYGLKELIYKTITTQVTKDVQTEQEKVLELFNYVHQRLTNPLNSVGTDVDQLHALTRNVAWCDQQASVLATLARKIGIKGGWASFSGGDDEVHLAHSFGLVHIGGKYRMLDPQKGFVFTNQDGTLATIEDLEHPAQLKSKQHEALKWLTGQGVNDIGLSKKKYLRIFENSPSRRLKYRELRWQGFQRNLVSKIIGLYYETFGAGFLTFFEELYFLIDETPPFLKARLKHISFRHESALSDYNTILLNKSLAKSSNLLLIDYSNISDDIVASEVMFFQGMLFWEDKSFAKSAEIFEALLNEFPDTRWVGLIYFYLGNSYENLNEIEKAINFYRAITIDIKSNFVEAKTSAQLVETLMYTPAAIRLHYLTQKHG